MFEQRDLKIDLLAIGLFALVAFLTLSVLTFDPADPTIELVYPINQLYQADVSVHPVHPQPHNACGRWGAFTADLLLRGFGLGAYYLVLSLGVVTGLLLLRREISAPAVRLVGWTGSLAGLTTLAAMFLPGLMQSPVSGSGGYLGLLGRGILETHFAMLGGLILAGSLLVVGLLLCTDYVLLHLAVLMIGGTLRGVHQGQQRLQSKRPGAKALAGDGTTNGSSAGVSVRIRGQRIDAPSADVGVVDIEEVDEDELEDSAEADDEAADMEDDEDGDEEGEDESEDSEDDADDEAESSPAAAAVSSESSMVRMGGRKRFLPSLKVRRPPDEADRDEVMQQLDEASEAEDSTEYELPSVELLAGADDFCFDEQAKEVRRKAKILEKTFASFGFKVKVVEIETGPVIAQYEVELESGLRLSKITGLADDLAIALRVPSVRIVAPIPGKNTVGIEVPNEQRQVVRLREVIEEANGRIKKMRIPLFLGKDVSGNALVVDLSTLPHLLIAGRTGTGKSVCLNAIIASILMTRRPDEVRMLMIDPKMVELSGYKSLPHLMHPVVTDMRKAEAILAWAVDKMEERYALLARAGVRHISGYNQLNEEELMDRLQPETDEERGSIPLHMPYIVIVADEMADLMMTSGKEVEQHIIRLAQKSRAVGIHLILATQKPTVDVITGLIKSNLPARIAFQVASRTDSRVVLDEMGADKLLGSGDMLFLWPGTSTLLRGQGTYLSDEEINAVVEVASRGQQNFVRELVQLKVEKPGEGEAAGNLKERDELYDDAIEVVVREGRGSVSLLQRALGIGYGRAARLIDFMAEDGFVGTYAGSQAREVLITMEDLARLRGEAPGTPAAAKPTSLAAAPSKSAGTSNVTLTRKNKIQPAPWEEDDTQEPPPLTAKRAAASHRIEPDEDQADSAEAESDEEEDWYEESDEASEDGDEVEDASGIARDDEDDDEEEEEDEEDREEEEDEYEVDEDEDRGEFEDDEEYEYDADGEEVELTDEQIAASGAAEYTDTTNQSPTYDEKFFANHQPDETARVKLRRPSPSRRSPSQ